MSLGIETSELLVHAPHSTSTECSIPPRVMPSIKIKKSDLGTSVPFSKRCSCYSSRRSLRSDGSRHVWFGGGGTMPYSQLIVKYLAVCNDNLLQQDSLKTGFEPTAHIFERRIQFPLVTLLTQMSSLAALASMLLLISGFVVAQISAPACLNGSLASWAWTFNSLDQNACTVAAYLMSTCNGGSFTINPLQPGHAYTGPTGATGINDSNMCKCNTVMYSLLSACDACEGVYWFGWDYFLTNCTQTLPPSTFPLPVPAGTRVPKWALLDITDGAHDNNWNANISQLTGDAPEVGPGGVIGPSGVSTAASATGTATRAISTATRSTSADNSPSPTSESSSNEDSPGSNGGIVWGGIGAGIGGVSIASVAILFYLRRRRPQTPSTPLTAQPQMEQAQQPLPMPLSDNRTFAPSSAPEVSMAQMRPHNSNDPTTSPGYQARPPDIPPQMDQVHQPPPLPDNETFAPSSAPEMPIAPMRLYVRDLPLCFCVLMRFPPVRPEPK
ncbi:hypothetical protein BJV74DRAFT_263903 [Russula compacta]|nr:hypothetical protein BJV74DRAFT_263903 [Russula compacta]